MTKRKSRSLKGERKIVPKATFIDGILWIRTAYDKRGKRQHFLSQQRVFSTTTSDTTYEGTRILGSGYPTFRKAMQNLFYKNAEL